MWAVRKVFPEDKSAILGELSENIYEGHDYLYVMGTSYMNLILGHAALTSGSLMGYTPCFVWMARTAQRLPVLRPSLFLMLESNVFSFLLTCLEQLCSKRCVFTRNIEGNECPRRLPLL
jgi:hypothetical protein